MRRTAPENGSSECHRPKAAVHCLYCIVFNDHIQPTHAIPRAPHFNPIPSRQCLLTLPFIGRDASSYRKEETMHLAGVSKHKLQTHVNLPAAHCVNVPSELEVTLHAQKDS